MEVQAKVKIDNSLLEDHIFYSVKLEHKSKILHHVLVFLILLLNPVNGSDV